MHTHQTHNRRNILVGLTVSAGAIATTGCDVPQPASLENSGMAGLDYSELDYSKLDYSKIDYSQLDPEQMGECALKNVPGQALSDELRGRLEANIGNAKNINEEFNDPRPLETLLGTIQALHNTNEVFAQYQDYLLCW